MVNIFFLILFSSIFISCVNNDNRNHIDATSNNNQEINMDLEMDFLDAYKLTIGKTFLYGKYEDFIADFGLPTKLTIVKKEYTILKKEELDKLIMTAKNLSGVTLHYPGIDMSYSYDNSIIPFIIDFRKTEKSVTYGQSTFDTTYTIEQFKKQFPKSANPLLKLPQSLFEITTKEKGDNFKSYMLIRKSKDDPNSTPMIEFSFDNCKLIFILFANF